MCLHVNPTSLKIQRGLGISAFLPDKPITKPYHMPGEHMPFFFLLLPSAKLLFSKYLFFFNFKRLLSTCYARPVLYLMLGGGGDIKM